MARIFAKRVGFSTSCIPQLTLSILPQPGIHREHIAPLRWRKERWARHNRTCILNQELLTHQPRTLFLPFCLPSFKISLLPQFSPCHRTAQYDIHFSSLCLLDIELGLYSIHSHTHPWYLTKCNANPSLSHGCSWRCCRSSASRNNDQQSPGYYIYKILCLFHNTYSIQASSKNQIPQTDSTRNRRF